MGTFASLQKLYDNIEKSNAALDPAEVRAETERYVSNVTTGISTIDAFYDLFDNAFAGSPNVHRFSRSERARRRAVSASIRRAMISYISDRSTLPEAEPWLQNFLRPTGNGEHAGIYKEQNDRRMLQFQPDTDAGRSFVESYVADVMEYDPKLSREAAAAQTEQELQKLRGDFTERLVMDSARVMEHLDRMFDPGLPPDTLAANIAEIMRIKRINDCMETYLEKANNGFMPVSDEIKAMMEQQIKLRPRLTMTVNKLEAMANPMYEYFDVDCLGAYDVSAIRKVWEEEFITNEAPAWREKKSRKHAHFNQYVTAEVQDNFTSFLENAANYSEARQELSRQQLQEAAAEYGFDLKETFLFRETPSTVDSPDKKKEMQKTGATHTLDGWPNLHLYQDTPVVYHQGERAVIFTPAETLTALTTSRPEELYNYSFAGTTANLEKTLEDADRWYKTNKHGYGSMRKQLREITKMGKLPKNLTPDDIRKRKDACQALLQSSEAYIHRKGENAQGRDDVESARIAAAKRAKTFADMKLRELDLIVKAMATAPRRRDAAPEQIPIPAANRNVEQVNAAPAEENPGGNLINEAPAADIRARRENNPVTRLHQRYSEKFAEEHQLPQSLAKLMEENLTDLERRWDNDTIYVENPTSWEKSTCGSYDIALGAITAAEMILAERKRLGGKGGPMETFFAEADKNLYDTLGYSAFVSFSGKTGDNKADKEIALQEFDPRDSRFSPATYAEKYKELYRPMFRQNIAVRYRGDSWDTGDPRRDNALRQFVQTHILDGLDARLQSGFLEQTPMGGNLDYLANCMVRDIVLLERGNPPAEQPGELEEMMINSPAKLIADIKKSPSFRFKTARMKRLHRKMNAFFTDSAMKYLAMGFIGDHNDKIRKGKEEDASGELVGSKDAEIDVEKMSENEKKEYAEKELCKLFSKDSIS